MPILPLVLNLNYFPLRNPTPGALLRKMSSKAKLIVEYAKSGRASCKKCSTAIASGAPRLGLVSRDARGFDMTKWHHLQCLPLSSGAATSPDSIKGFSSLKSDDQEELKKLIESSEKVLDGEDDSKSKAKRKSKVRKTVDDPEGHDVGESTLKKIKSDDQEELKKLIESSEKVLDGEDDSKSKAKRKTKVHKTVDDPEDHNTGESTPKKIEVSESAEEDELEISMSPSDIKDVYKNATLPPQWKAFQTVIYLEKVDGLLDSQKIAAFDFDGCLAKTSVKKTGADAWSLMYPTIPEKLNSLHKDGYKLVIFTNEANIERWKNKRQAAVDSKIGRLANFMKKVNVPIQIFIACGNSSAQPKDAYRKPKTGMWHLMERHFNSGLKIDMENSFYVGDAAGRSEDHSDADIKFAEIIGLKFHLPEVFLKKSED